MQRKTSILNNLDWPTILLYGILVIMGWFNIYAAVYNEEHSSIFDMTQRYGKQMIWIIAALIIAVFVLMTDFNFFYYFAYFLYGISIAILIVVVLVGKEIHGAKSWFTIGGFNLQPSEFVKFITALALARYLSSYEVDIKRLSSIFVLVVIIFLPALLILLQPDTGTALVFTTFVIVLYREGLSRWLMLWLFVMPVLFIVSMVYQKEVLIPALAVLSFIGYCFINPRTKYIFFAIGIFFVIYVILRITNLFMPSPLSVFHIMLISLILSSLTFLIFSIVYKVRFVFTVITFFAATVVFTQSVDYVFHNIIIEHQQQRINILLGLESDPLGVGYNVNQSKIAIGSGGFAGKGFLQGTQTKYNFVPEQSTDFIFCTVGEEWGFIGSFTVVMLFLVLFLRLIIIAERQRWSFARIYGYSVVAILFSHVAINIGMTIGMVPVIGIPLPFFSYGGSSLWAFTILLFIFINLDARRLDILT